jgi:hypothetical protein
MLKELLQKSQTAVRNPRSIKRYVNRKAYTWSHIPANKKKAFEQRQKDSEYGLVVNWGLHKAGDWTVAMYPYFVRQFIEEFDPIIISSQRTYEKHNKDLQYIFAFGARNSKGPTIDYTGNQKVLLFASDPNNRSEWLSGYIKQNEISHVLTPYYSPFRHYLPDIEEKKVVHFPWAVPRQFVIDPEEVRDRGTGCVGITGASGTEIYETRDWCRTQPGVRSFTTSGHQNSQLSNKGYYTWLKNFDAMIAAGSFKPRWQFLFAKYYEIPAVGSLLFAQYSDDLSRAGFTKRNCVIFKTRDEFTREVEKYLDSPESYIQKRRRGVELIRNGHTIEQRIELIKTLFK